MSPRQCVLTFSRLRHQPRDIIGSAIWDRDPGCSARPRKSDANMKLKLAVRKDGVSLCEGTYDVSDADSFGQACAQLWTQLLEQKLEKTNSIGALFDALDDRLLDELYGSEIILCKA